MSDWKSVRKETKIRTGYVLYALGIAGLTAVFVEDASSGWWRALLYAVVISYGVILLRLDHDPEAPPQMTIRTDIHRHDFQPTDDSRGTVCSCGLSHVHEFVGPGDHPDDGRLSRCVLDACGRWFEDEEATR